MNNLNLKDADDQSIEEEFADIVRHRLTDQQFIDWFLKWFDLEIVVDQALNWDVEVKRESLKELYDIMK